MKEIWVVWNMDDEYEFFSTKEKARKRCIDIIVDVMMDDRDEMAECLLELAEYDSVTDICGFYSDVIDPYDEEEYANEEVTEDCEEESDSLLPDFKFHIYNKYYDDLPLTNEGYALEFDTEEAALRFLLSVKENMDFDLDGAYIKEDMLFYDGGYVNATNFIIDEEGRFQEAE